MIKPFVSAPEPPSIRAFQYPQLPFAVVVAPRGDGGSKTQNNFSRIRRIYKAGNRRGIAHYLPCAPPNCHYTSGVTVMKFTFYSTTELLSTCFALFIAVLAVHALPQPMSLGPDDCPPPPGPVRRGRSTKHLIFTPGQGVVDEFMHLQTFKDHLRRTVGCRDAHDFGRHSGTAGGLWPQRSLRSILTRRSSSYHQMYISQDSEKM